MRISLAIRDFMSEKKLENVSKATIAGYEHLFRDFQSYCEKEELERVQDINSRVMKNYFVYLQNERSNNEVSRNTKRKNLNVFFRFLISEEILEVNPVDKIVKAKEEKKLKVYTDEQVNEILTHLKRRKRRVPREQAFFAVRDYHMFVFLVSSGVRNGELVSIRWEWVDFKNNTIKIFGKSRTDKFIPVATRLMKELAFWKEYTIEELGYLPEYVFPNRKGKTLTTNAIKCFHTKLSNTLGFRCSCHSARHYFAKNFLSQSNDIFTLSKLLGHASLKTTEVYLSHFGTELADKNEQFNVINGLDL